MWFIAVLLAAFSSSAQADYPSVRKFSVQWSGSYPLVIVTNAYEGCSVLRAQGEQAGNSWLGDTSVGTLPPPGESGVVNCLVGLSQFFGGLGTWPSCGAGAVLEGDMCVFVKDNSCTDTDVGNPCDASTGNKHQTERDTPRGDGVPALNRRYNSRLNQVTEQGSGWSSTASRRIVFVQTEPAEEAAVRHYSVKWSSSFPLVVTTNALDACEELRTQAGQAGYTWSGITTAGQPPGYGTGSTKCYAGGKYFGGLGSWVTCSNGQTSSGQLCVGEESLQPHLRSPEGYSEPFDCPATGTCSVTADSDLKIVADANSYTVTRPDGSVEYYNKPSGTPLPNAIEPIAWEKDHSGRTTSYSYNGSNQLTEVTGPFGHELAFTYDTSGRLETVTQPSGQVSTYIYDGNGNLVRTDYSDDAAKIYHYEDTNFNRHLTGISFVEPDTTTTRYSTYAYDTNRKAVSTEHAGGVEKFTLSYDSATQTTVEDAIGTENIYTFAQKLSVKLLTSKVNQTDSKSLVQTFDTSNNLTCRKNEEGNVTTYTYNSSNQKTSMTEGQTGSCASPTRTGATRTLTYGYLSADLDLLTSVTAPSVKTGEDKTTTIAYGDSSHPYLQTSITQSGFTPGGTAVSRATAFTYTSAGQLATLNGPRTDVNDTTTFTYYNCTTGDECGQLASVTNALSQVTTFDTYDGNGRVTQITDPNGLETNYTYDARGRVTSIVQTPPTGSARTTGYTYNAAGNVTSVTFPDSTTLAYTYNAAQLLTQVTDELDNTITYAYDLKGNRTEEKIYDPTDTLVRQVTTAYDLRNRVSAINAGGSLTELVYDAIGNLTSETDPNENPSTTHDYDALNRLTETVDAISGVTAYDYTVTDQLAEVVAPNGAVTQYVYDDLGNLLQEISPDRGTTTYTYDDAGNRITQTDARNITVTYTYDALNRVTGIAYPDSSENVTYTYDQTASGNAGIGRLTQIDDHSGSTQYHYDRRGNITTVTTTINVGVQPRIFTTHYAYDLADNLIQITYPDNRTIDYTRNSIGQISAVTTTYNSQTQNLATGVDYQPFGPVKAFTYGNSLTHSRVYDLDGRLDSVTTTGIQSLDYNYDPNSNVSSILDLLDTLRNQSFDYDLLNRLTDGTGIYGDYDFDYDGVGNRTEQILDNQTSTYSYVTDSQKLNSISGAQTASYAYDAVGNTLSKNSDTFTYNDANRLETATVNSLVTTYHYNALGQRVLKTNTNETVLYLYDLNGQLLAEADSSGVIQKEYAYMNGEPLAQIDAPQNLIYYYHNSHLGTPQVMTNDNQDVVWKANYTPFGDAQITVDTVTNNLRFPGQYADSETGLHYNYFRYYDPATGRYITSDPIGLDGGINTYVYVESNPMIFTDPAGLHPIPNTSMHPGGPRWHTNPVGGHRHGQDMHGTWRTEPADSNGNTRNFEFNWDETQVNNGGEYVSCTVKCLVEVAVGEAVTQTAEKAASRIAKDVASELIQKAIKGGGIISTLNSVREGVNCTIECSYCR